MFEAFTWQEVPIPTGLDWGTFDTYAVKLPVGVTPDDVLPFRKVVGYGMETLVEQYPPCQEPPYPPDVAVAVVLICLDLLTPTLILVRTGFKPTENDPLCRSIVTELTPLTYFGLFPPLNVPVEFQPDFEAPM